ncbi:ribosome biogenesis protein, putative [Plasmodium knowlesi strain H]|uniref:Ribosome biogenesis protein, putative n=3 Tax=Plasmodium knowlesi TaxID=5850 RepID=A0A5K1TWG3_PLAKH|nr:ribosome biogenesis protein, putative [Plasmodium knowlesi strain H]OTN63879.1 putative Ribosome biogenesis protein [Plasmodium knowlesi]CAA9991044.1 ribosome biogenesis protein, putative [Plasmodium knowlesi strain H]SBO20672.1 ribosome biogenesis protein, putative [Plasmodium knowlesi strain H]SBO21100.1 ribosome biogenesis protein, putative [Plasmodium knowlesi strain H]VVS80518.1 ribosome biogenesis protein, putative [Plasmodium knowlesi strain H]|eukprot:XP_002262326.1 ribosome biogenesis protein, putative [Plasmodium knowlesi strain H]
MEGKISMQKNGAVGNKKSNRGGKHVIRRRREDASQRMEKRIGKQKGRSNEEGRGVEETECGAPHNGKYYNPVMKGKGANCRFNTSMFRNGHRNGNMRGVPGKGKYQSSFHGGRRKSRNDAERYSYGGISTGDVDNQGDEDSGDTNSNTYYYDNESSAASEGEAPMEQINHEEEASGKEPHINSDQQPTMDYMEYKNSLKKGEDPKCDNKNTLDPPEGKEEIGVDVPSDDDQKGVFKIFLLFSPLAITSIRNRKCVINADEHMLFLENQLKGVQDLLSSARSAKENVFLKNKVEAIENKLRNVRLDILFFTLLCLRDSVINKRGKLQIYVHTVNGLLIFVSPSFRVPRSFSLFKKVMLNLMLRNVVLDPDGRPLLKVLSHPVKHYVGSSVCIGISSMGFPADVKKLTKKIKETRNEYSFFLSLSTAFDLTHFIELISKTDSESFPFDYIIRLSDLPLSTVAVCSKLTHFLNE